MEKNYPDVLCSQRNNVCYFDKPCSDVAVKDQELKVTVGDDGSTTFELKVSEKELFIGGDQLGASDRLCYVPVFQSKLGYTDLWLAGAALMKEYYVVYDMTPYDERGEKYIQMGLGL